MHRGIVALLLVAVLARAQEGVPEGATAAAAAVASDVVTMTQAAFDESIKQGNWLLEFYAPWCGHSKRLAPTYEIVATHLKGQVNVAKVDCTVEQDLCARFAIKGFPTLKYYVDGAVVDYSGDRTLDSFVKFTVGEEHKKLPRVALPGAGGTQSTSAPPSHVHPPAPVNPPLPDAPLGPTEVVTLTEANFEELTSRGAWLIEFYAPWCGHCKNMAPAYEQAAIKLKGQVSLGKVDCTVERALARRFNIKGFPTIKLLRDNSVRDYSGDRSIQSFVDFTNAGWQTAPATVLPDAPSLFARLGETVGKWIATVEEPIRDKLWVAVALVFVIGVVVGRAIAPAVGPAPANVKQD
jgi:protein disulfide-isomerase-like protein